MGQRKIGLVVGLAVVALSIIAALATAACTKPATTPSASAERKSTGIVTQMNGSLLTIRTDDGETMTRAFDTFTRLDSGSMTDLQPGARVTITYNPSAITAISIEKKPTSAPAPTTSVTPGQTPAADNKAPASSFVANLTPDVVTPVNPDAHGQAIFYLNGNEIRFTLSVSSISDVNAAFVYQGTRDQSGQIVAWLYPSGPPAALIRGRFDGVLADGRITASSLVGPMQGQPVTLLADRMRSGLAVVSVATTQRPNGEIKGAVVAQTSSAAVPSTPRVSSGIPEFEGTITEMSGATVTVKTDGGGKLVFTVDASTWVQLDNGRTGSLADLKTGGRVEVYLSPTGDKAYKIELRDTYGLATGKVEGSISDVQGANVVIMTPAGTKVMVELVGGTLIERADSSSATRADLKIGANVEAYFNYATTTAFRIELKN